MRLLNSTTQHFEDFLGADIPMYVILSHTWGPEEVSYQDMKAGQASGKAGFSKIEGCCAKARRDGFSWVWIDTCCIDKSSSAELSEAINSMYKWYEGAVICYAYLTDFLTRFSVRDPLWEEIFDVKKVFKNSRWFTRGWTLQELIAPVTVEFYASDWTEIGTKLDLARELAVITGISMRVLRGASPLTCNVAERMSWAAFRKTTRVEDMAYCLLGIFQINMPLLYGEGKRAFHRLQGEIMKASDDYTLLAWPIKRPNSTLLKPRETTAWSGVLADSIEVFRTGDDSYPQYSDIESLDQLSLISGRRGPAPKFDMSTFLNTPPVLTSRGLRLHIPLLENDLNRSYSAFLYCRTQAGSSLVCISLNLIDLGCGWLMEKSFSGNGGLHLIPGEKFRDFKARTVYIRQASEGEDYRQPKEMQILSAKDFCIVSQELKDRNLTLLRRTTMIGDHYGTLEFKWKETGDEFLVRFGFKHYGPWCEVVISGAYCDGELGKNPYPGGYNKDDSSDSEAFDSSTSSTRHRVRTDRVTKLLGSGLASVYAAVRKRPGHIILQISIS